MRVEIISYLYTKAEAKSENKHVVTGKRAVVRLQQQKQHRKFETKA